MIFLNEMIKAMILFTLFLLLITKSLNILQLMQKAQPFYLKSQMVLPKTLGNITFMSKEQIVLMTKFNIVINADFSYFSLST
jgi:hypothetical protein